MRVLEDGETVAEYEWEGLLRLIRHVAVRNGLGYIFSYGTRRAPERVTITGNPENVRRATGVHAGRLTLCVGVDQVDSVRLLAAVGGWALKCLECDSFGNVVRDYPAWLAFPARLRLRAQ